LACNKSVGEDNSSQDKFQERFMNMTGCPIKLGEKLDMQFREYVWDL